MHGRYILSEKRNKVNNLRSFSVVTARMEKLDHPDDNDFDRGTRGLIRDLEEQAIHAEVTRHLILYLCA
jgi:hypothetical protein